MRDEHIRRLMVDHHDAVARYVARRLPADEVSDVVAEVFVTAWQRSADLGSESATPELAWLYGVARNKIAHRRRDHARRTRLVDRLRLLNPVAAAADPGDGIVAADRIARAARRLSSRERELLELISWERLTSDELAVVLGCSVNTVHQRIHRLRKNLNAHIEAIDQPAQPAKRGMTSDHL